MEKEMRVQRHNTEEYSIILENSGLNCILPVTHCSVLAAYDFVTFKNESSELCGVCVFVRMTTWSSVCILNMAECEPATHWCMWFIFESVISFNLKHLFTREN